MGSVHPIKESGVSNIAVTLAMPDMPLWSCGVGLHTLGELFMAHRPRTQSVYFVSRR